MQALTFIIMFVAVLALIGVVAWLIRRFASNRLGANTNRGRMPRLAVFDGAAGDGRARAACGRGGGGGRARTNNTARPRVRGAPTDLVVEPNIVRAMPGRDQLPA